MKKYFIISFLALLGMSQAAAQEYEYVPFVREGVKWICSNYYTLQQSHFTLELKGDAVINGVTYKAMHYYSGEEIDSNNDTIPVYMREEGKVVYAIVPDGKTYEGCPIGFDHDAETQEKIAAGEEFVLYDFNDAEGFIGRWIDMPFQACTVIPDMTAVGGWLAKRYIAKIDDEFCAIEGIGYDGLKSWYTLGNRDHYVLDWVIENGDTIYQSERYKGVYPGRLSSDLMPMAREGVKWVNERVVIENGDTTRSYYTYEFSGTNSRGYPICYSYTGESLDPSQAQEVALFQGEYDHASFSNYFYNNLPYNRIIEQGRDMIRFPGVMMYQFAYTNSDIEMTNPVNYYITSQKEDFLARANFVEVEPVVIEGFECRRYAYYGDSDEPLCYVVEGIGFDSRDMGDLLTPFTRKPDPNADYQEYWGLSHVIKDGQIIYKGMCYKEPEESDYIPFVREGVKWVCYSKKLPINQSTIEPVFTLEFKGDAVINGVTYKAMHKYSGEEIDPNNDTIPVYMREEGKVVYAIVPDGKTYEDCPIDCFSDSTINEDIMAGREFVLYDFNDPEGFIMSRITYNDFIVHPVMPQNIMLGDRSVKRYVFSTRMMSGACFIEGIGCDGLTQGYPLAFPNDQQLGESRMYLDHVIEDGKVIYRSERFNLREDEYPELVREGVKWVNERVIIEHGDTTRNYYTYEFKDENNWAYRLCHYYEGNSLDSENDSVIAAVMSAWNGAVVMYNMAVTNLRNNSPERLMINWYVNNIATLYTFVPYEYYESVLCGTNPISFFSFMQTGDELTLDNFVEVEPVWIEGQRCKRYAYYGDGDEPLCYVVEGIGFDSRDMGDLLTPFTRKPDPDADYQEYWGLSHVIKDGKIIYKGMCYNNSDNVPGLPGDVNGDMVTNINDVVEIIEFLLESFNATIPSYDVNLDGLVNIADVTSLIGMLLANDESSINLRDKSNNPTRDESINDKPYVIYKNDTHSIIIYGTKAVDYYDVDITSVTTGVSMISTWVDGSYGTIDVSTLPIGEYCITVNSPAWGNFEGNFEVY